jgi:hypothetical protein
VYHYFIEPVSQYLFLYISAGKGELQIIAKAAVKNGRVDRYLHNFLCGEEGYGRDGLSVRELHRASH